MYTIQIRQCAPLPAADNNHVGEWIKVVEYKTKPAAIKAFHRWCKSHGWVCDIELVSDPHGFHLYHEHSNPNIPTLVS